MVDGVSSRIGQLGPSNVGLTSEEMQVYQGKAVATETTTEALPASVAPQPSQSARELITPLSAEDLRLGAPRKANPYTGSPTGRPDDGMLRVVLTAMEGPRWQKVSELVERGLASVPEGSRQQMQRSMSRVKRMGMLLSDRMPMLEEIRSYMAGHAES